MTAVNRNTFDPHRDYQPNYTQDNAKLQQTLNKALNKVKLALMSRPQTVFVCNLLFSMKFEWSARHLTAATNGTNLWFNPNFFMHDLNHEERVFVLAHEAWHPAFDHLGRLQNRHPIIWNMAGDYVINALLKNAGFVMPPFGLYDKKYENMSTEQVYDDLMASLTDEQKQALEDNFIKDIEAPTDENGQPLSPEQQKQWQHRMDNNLVRAKIEAEKRGERLAGNIPQEIAVHLDQLLNPKLPWNVILQNYMTAYTAQDYSLRKPQRRYLPNYYLPSLFSEGLTSVCVFFDLSGSVSDHEVSQFFVEVRMIQERLQPQTLKIITFTTEIVDIFEYECGASINDIQLVGRGGTDIEPVLSYIKDHQPEVTLIFTDGFFSHPDIVTRCDIFWIIIDNPRFEFPEGKIIYYDKDD